MENIINVPFKRKNTVDSDIFVVDRIEGDFVIFKNNARCSLSMLKTDFEQTNNEDGVISGKLVKPKYNEVELVKSIDTRIFELLPPEPPPFDDRVPRPIYNEATQSVIDLTAQVVTLNRTVLDLRAKVQDVEIVSESLKVQLDLKDLNLAASQNQTGQLTTKISSTITELQNSIQKGTSEAIQRVSLYARNQSLEQELSALRIAASAK